LAIRTLPLQPFQFGEFESKRRVASFAFRYDYDLPHWSGPNLPASLAEIIGTVETFGGHATWIQRVLCTEYDVGVGIGWHCDKPHFDQIFRLSLDPPRSSGFANAPALGIASRSLLNRGPCVGCPVPRD
jgi:alkylated DNA repair dioxygenase AlkB